MHYVCQMQNASKSYLNPLCCRKIAAKRKAHTWWGLIHGVAVVVGILPTRYNTDLVINHYTKSLINSLTAFVIGHCPQKRLRYTCIGTHSTASFKCLANILNWSIVQMSSQVRHATLYIVNKDCLHMIIIWVLTQNKWFHIQRLYFVQALN